ncbi:hypothetical protein LWI28_010210 [Acer negundo]|uniref:Uncharacterized protein n=1 Tax=Acer negundo TaxID=4023 RepID=A0AAD5JAU8_ACENE|nr:hypothetical protein LWI28_010210 [Acer negundo]
MQALTYRLDQVHFDIESKYNLEIQDLKDCLLLEREEKNELHQNSGSWKRNVCYCSVTFVHIGKKLE